MFVLSSSRTKSPDCCRMHPSWPKNKCMRRPSSSRGNGSQKIFGKHELVLVKATLVSVLYIYFVCVESHLLSWPFWLPSQSLLFAADVRAAFVRSIVMQFGRMLLGWLSRFLHACVPFRLIGLESIRHLIYLRCRYGLAGNAAST